MKIDKFCRQWTLSVLVSMLSACGGGSSPVDSSATVRDGTNPPAQVLPAQKLPPQAAAPLGDSFDIPTIDKTSWKTLTSPRIPGKAVQYSNDHTVIKGGDGNWHVIGISGGGSGDENSLYHSVLSSLYPPKPVANTGDYKNLDANGQDTPIAAFKDKNGTPCNAHAPVALNYQGAVYLLFRSDRDIDGICGKPDITRLEILKSTDKKLEVWTSVNTYPTKDSPNTPTSIGVTVSGTPNEISSATGWANHFRDPGILRQDDGTYLLYTLARAVGKPSVVPVYSSKDLLNWEYKGTALTLGPHATEMGGGATESPFAFKHGDWYYLSVTDTDSSAGSYESTILLRSKDATNFGSFDGSDLARSSPNIVERLKVHAPEYLQDDSGQWYITACGWQDMASIPEAKRGVAIAKLNFASLTDGLQARFSFEKDAVGKDLSGYGHVGTLVDGGSSTPTTGPVLIEGVAGNALQLSGKQNYLSVDPIELSGDFTIDAWVETTGKPTNSDGIFHTSDGHDLNFHDGYPRLYVGNGLDALTSSLVLPQGKWTHIALTRTGTTVSMYLNGIKTAQGVFNGVLKVDSFGRTVQGSLTGALDEIHVYNRALSIPEIEFLRLSSTLQGKVPLAGYSFDGDFTLSAWTYITRKPSNGDQLFSGKSSAAPDVQVNFYDQKPRFYNGSGDVAVADAVVGTNGWNHVAVTRSGNAITLYVNGYPSGTTGNWADAFEIAQIGDGSKDLWQGMLSGVDLETRARSATEITTQAKGGFLEWVP